MKKITLLLLFSFCLTNSQEITITMIDGMTPANFQTATPTLTENETHTLTVTYTDIEAHTGPIVTAIGMNIGARFLDNFDEISTPVLTPITTSSSQQTFQVNVVVPNVTADTDLARFQVFGHSTEVFSYAGNASNACCGLTFSIDDVLSLNDFEKELSSSFYDKSTKSFVYNENTNTNYKILDITGRTILSGITKRNISLESLNKGLYIFRIGRATKKFVIE